MKSSEEVLARIHGLLNSEIDRRLEESVKRLPHLCLHNHRQLLDVRKTVNGTVNPKYNRIDTSNQTIGLCMLGAENPDDWKGTICEDPIDAQRCPYFDPVRNKSSILDEFKAQLEDPQWLSHNMPHLLELLWVIEMTSAPKLSLWKRFLVWITKCNLEPVTSVDVTRLLPSNEDIRS